MDKKQQECCLLPATKNPQKDIPGRPIVSASSCPAKRSSELVNLILNPLAIHTNSYIRDTIDFINKIESLHLNNKETILASLDVTLLYTSIFPGILV